MLLDHRLLLLGPPQVRNALPATPIPPPPNRSPHDAWQASCAALHPPRVPCLCNPSLHAHTHAASATYRPPRPPQAPLHIVARMGSYYNCRVTGSKGALVIATLLEQVQRVRCCE